MKHLLAIALLAATSCTTAYETFLPRAASALEASKALYAVQCTGDEVYEPRCAEQRKLVNELIAAYNELNEGAE